MTSKKENIEHVRGTLKELKEYFSSILTDQEFSFNRDNKNQCDLQLYQIFNNIEIDIPTATGLVTHFELVKSELGPNIQVVFTKTLYIVTIDTDDFSKVQEEMKKSIQKQIYKTSIIDGCGHIEL